MLGVDVYEFDNSDANYQQNLAATLDVLMEAAKKVGKIPALTETGCRGISSKKDWFTQTLWPVLQKYQLVYPNPLACTSEVSVELCTLLA